MSVVTSLETQTHDPERVNVFLDGEFGFGLAAGLVMARGLRVGDELSEKDIEDLRQGDAVERAHGAALNFLSYRPRSRREIEIYLRKRDTEPQAIEVVIGRLENSGLVDDREFARFWIDNRQTFRPRGTRALKMELRQKGLDSQDVDEALQTLGDEEDTAYAAAQSRLRTFAALDDREFFRKMVAFLARRGFPYDASSAATKRLLAERGGELPSDED